MLGAVLQAPTQGAHEFAVMEGPFAIGNTKKAEYIKGLALGRLYKDICGICHGLPGP